jgi:hypothetical protein
MPIAAKLHWKIFYNIGHRSSIRRLESRFHSLDKDHKGYLERRDLMTIPEVTVKPGNTKGGSITLPLTFCLTGLESAVWQLTIFVFYLQNRLFQSSQAGGQRYSDTSPFSIPWWNFLEVHLHVSLILH